MQYHRHLTVAVPTLIAVTATLSAADTATGPVSVPPPAVVQDMVVLVTATRLERDALSQPYSLHQMDRTQLDRQQARSLTDAIDRMPGVAMQKTAANQASPYIRGLTGEQTLLMFDGVRLSHALFRSGPNQYAAMIPDEAIDRVDVILGSGSTMMGSDGLTGTMDFRLAPAGRGRSETLSPWIASRYATADGGQMSGGVDGNAGSWAYSVDASWADFHDRVGGKDAADRLRGPVDGDTIPNTGYEQFSVGSRVAYSGFDKQVLSMAIGHVEQQDTSRPDGFAANSKDPSRISRTYDPQMFSYAHLRHSTTDLKPWSRTQATVWFHRHLEHQEREDITGGRYRRREFDDAVNTLGLDLQFNHVFSGHGISYGCTMYQDRIDSDMARYRSINTDPNGAVPDQNGAFNPGATTVPDGSRQRSIGFFAQDLWTLSSEWELLAGMRYDHFSWHVPLTDDRAGFTGQSGVIDDGASAWTGNLRVSWRPTTHVVAYSGVSQGFRTPTISDLAGIQDRASNNQQTQGNPKLEPEHSVTWELGARLESGRDTASIAIFQTDLRNLITVRFDGATPRAVNAADGRLRGGEFACDVGLPVGLPEGWRLAVVQATSVVAGVIDVPQANGSTQQQRLSRANQLFGSIGLQIEQSACWHARATLRWADEYDRPSPSDAGDVRHTTVGRSDGSMPGWAVTDLKAGWHSTDGKLRIDGGCENIFNATYRQVGSAMDGNGRSLVIGGAVRF